MLSERQRNIAVELTPVGRTAQDIANRFNCSISTIRQIRKRFGEIHRWRRLPGSGRPKKTTARDECYLRRLVKHIQFHSLAQVTHEFVTHLGHPVSKRTVQRRFHVQAFYSRVAVQNREFISRTSSDDDDGVLESSTGQYQTTGPAYFFFRWIEVQHCVLWWEDKGMVNSRGEICSWMSMHGQ